MAVRGELAELAHQGDRLVEFLLRQAHLGGEAMQVADQGLQDLLQARILRPIGFVQDRLRQLGFIIDDHRSASRFLEES